MRLDLSAIQNPQVRTFYALWWPQHCAAYDFYARIPEDQFDYRMVDTPCRKSDTPRECLAHQLTVQMVYYCGIREGKLDFKSMDSEHYLTLSKTQLLAEWERIDQELFALLTAPGFDSDRQVSVFWGGKMNAIDVLFFLRDHDILHIGWNLAVMDHLNIPRFDSLIQYWGA